MPLSVLQAQELVRKVPPPADLAEQLARGYDEASEADKPAFAGLIEAEYVQRTADPNP